MAVDYNELERLRESEKELHRILRQRDVADALATQERLKREQAEADAAANEAARVAEAEQLEKARRASWRNYNLDAAIKKKTLHLYLDRPMSEIDATDCGPTGWPPGDGPHNYTSLRKV